MPKNPLSLGTKDNFTVYLDTHRRAIQIKNNNGEDANWSDSPSILQNANTGIVHAKASTDWMPVVPIQHPRTTFTFAFVSGIRGSSTRPQIITQSIQRVLIREILEAQAKILEAQAKILEAQAKILEVHTEILEVHTEIHIEMDLEAEHLSENP